MVYGDHGPYIELLQSNINWKNGFCIAGPRKRYERYYDEMFNPSKTVKLYVQIRE